MRSQFNALLYTVLLLEERMGHTRVPSASKQSFVRVERTVIACTVQCKHRVQTFAAQSGCGPGGIFAFGMLPFGNRISAFVLSTGA